MGKTLEKAMHLIAEAAALPDGWRFGQGRAMPDNVVVNAQQIARAFEAIPRITDVHVFPAEDGSLAIVGYADDCDAEVICRPDGLFDLTIDDLGDDEMVEGLQFGELQHRMKERGWWSSALSDAYTRRISTQKRGVSAASLSAIAAMVAVSPVSPALAQSTPLGISVTTSVNTTNPSRATHRSSGEFRRTRYHQKVA